MLGYLLRYLYINGYTCLLNIDAFINLFLFGGLPYVTYCACTRKFSFRVYVSGEMLLLAQRMKVLAIYYRTKLFWNLVISFRHFMLIKLDIMFHFFSQQLLH